VTAVAPVVVQCKGLWVGWPGIYAEDLVGGKIEIPESDPDDKTPTAGMAPEQVLKNSMTSWHFHFISKCVGYGLIKGRSCQFGKGNVLILLQVSQTPAKDMLIIYIVLISN